MRVKEEAFVESYLTNGFNASQAYADNIATTKAKPLNFPAAASGFLRKESVQSILSERLKARKKELHIDQNYVVNKLLEIVESDIVKGTQYLSKDELDKMPLSMRKMIKSIDVDKSTHKWNERNGTAEGEDHLEFEEKYKVTFMDKDKALDSLAKFTGAYMKDNISLQGNIETKSFTDALKDLDI